MEKVYSLYQVAKIFNVDYQTAWRWVKTGRLPGFKTPGNQWRVKGSELQSRLETLGLPLPQE
jgi:excisionase family DNA binding protein